MRPKQRRKGEGGDIFVSDLLTIVLSISPYKTKPKWACTSPSKASRSSEEYEPISRLLKTDELRATNRLSYRLLRTSTITPLKAAYITVLSEPLDFLESFLDSTLEIWATFVSAITERERESETETYHELYILQFEIMTQLVLQNLDQRFQSL